MSQKLRSVVHGLKWCSNDYVMRPRWMYLMFDRCNSRCQTCNIWQQKGCSNPITPEQLRGILQSPLFRDIEYFGITGGEPTLFDLSGFFHIIHEVLPNAKLTVSSNGLLPEKLYETVKDCLAKGIGLDVGLSLDGVGEFHDVWRGVKGNFAKVNWLVRQFKVLQKDYPELLSFGVGSTLTVETAKQADALLGYSRSVGVPFMWHWFNSTSFYHNSKREVDASVFASAILKVMGKSVWRSMWLNYLSTGKFPKLRCRALSNYLLLNCDGSVRPCLSIWDSNAGDMLKDDPVKVWFSKEATDIRNQVSRCNGCLNAWACNWNLVMDYPKYLVKKSMVRFQR